MKPIEAPTERLLLRQWRKEDLSVYAAMNADPAVMEFYPGTFAREESDAQARRYAEYIAEKGWGFWALEIRATREFIGFTGLGLPGYELPFHPCVEIGWKLGRKYWGRGYATEAGRAALEIGFRELELQEIVSFTAAINLRSRAVMRRLGMKDTGENFPHPLLPEASPLQEHVLYRKKREDER